MALPSSHASYSSFLDNRRARGRQPLGASTMSTSHIFSTQPRTPSSNVPVETDDDSCHNYFGNSRFFTASSSASRRMHDVDVTSTLHTVQVEEDAAHPHTVVCTAASRSATPNSTFVRKHTALPPSSGPRDLTTAGTSSTRQERPTAKSKVSGGSVSISNSHMDAEGAMMAGRNWRPHHRDQTTYPTLRSPDRPLYQQHDHTPRGGHRGRAVEEDPSALALALRAHWALAEKVMYGKPPQTASPQAEATLMCSLRSLPDHLNALVADADNTSPFLLAFATVAVPSVRTQVAAAAALRALIATLVSAQAWGKSRTTSLLHTLLLAEDQQGLTAVVQALSLAIQCSESAEQKQSMHSSEDMASTLVESLVELLLDATTLSPAVATALLTRPSVCQDLARQLPHASPMAACFTGGFWLNLANVPDAAEVLAAYGVHHAVLNYISDSVCAPSSGAAGEVAEEAGGDSRGCQPSELSGTATVTGLSLFLRLACRLCVYTPAFELLYESNGLCSTVGRLLAMRWADVVQLTCLWLAELLRINTRQGAILASNLVLKEGALSLLAGVLTWKRMTGYNLAAALAIRWIILCAPAAVGETMMSGVKTRQTNYRAVQFVILGCVDHLLCQANMSEALEDLTKARERLFAEEPTDTQIRKEKEMLSVSRRLEEDDTCAKAETCLLLIECALCLALCDALLPDAARRDTRQLLRARLSTSTLTTLRSRTEAVVNATDDTYFTALPAVVLSSETGKRGNDDATKGARTDDQCLSGTMVHTAEGWRHLCLSTIRCIFPALPSTSAAHHADNRSRHNSRRGSSTITDEETVPRSQDMQESIAIPHGLFTASPLSLASRRTLARSGNNVFVSGALDAYDPASETAIAAARGLHSNGAVGISSTITTRSNSKGIRARALSTGDAYLDMPVVRRARLLRGTFQRESIQAVLRLSNHYIHARRYRNRGTSVSGAESLCESRNDHRTIVSNSLDVSSSRQSMKKSQNPWAPPRKTRAEGITWEVKDLQRTDVLLFTVNYITLVSELPEAIASVTAHLAFLKRQLQLVPQREKLRRCLLNDLYMNVYPKMHLFLTYIQYHSIRSRAVLQLLSTADGGSLHSGNAIELYDAVAHCVGEAV